MTGTRTEITLPVERAQTKITSISRLDGCYRCCACSAAVVKWYGFVVQPWSPHMGDCHFMTPPPPRLWGTGLTFGGGITRGVVPIMDACISTQVSHCNVVSPLVSTAHMLVNLELMQGSGIFYRGTMNEHLHAIGCTVCEY